MSELISAYEKAKNIADKTDKYVAKLIQHLKPHVGDQTGSYLHIDIYTEPCDRFLCDALLNEKGRSEYNEKETCEFHHALAKKVRKELERLACEVLQDFRKEEKIALAKAKGDLESILSQLK